LTLLRRAALVPVAATPRADRNGRHAGGEHRLRGSRRHGVSVVRGLGLPAQPRPGGERRNRSENL